MSKDKTEKPSAAEQGNGLVAVVVLVDESFSSMGMHYKGDKVLLPEEDVIAMERNKLVTRV